jgi:hypothetical protein
MTFADLDEVSAAADDLKSVVCRLVRRSRLTSDPIASRADEFG